MTEAQLHQQKLNDLRTVWLHSEDKITNLQHEHVQAEALLKHYKTEAKGIAGTVKRTGMAQDWLDNMNEAVAKQQAIIDSYEDDFKNLQITAEHAMIDYILLNVRLIKKIQKRHADGYEV